MAKYHGLIAASAFVAALAIANLQALAAPERTADILSREESLVLKAATVSDPCQRFGARGWLRHRLVRESDLACYGLRLDHDWQRAPAHRPVVILVHGFNSGPGQNAELIKPILDEPFACGTFTYPNDHSIAASAKLLSAELRKFAKRYPERHIAMVCHSMGGLVARACIEDPELDPGNVERLIMIAPPTHGTIVAHFAVGTDLYEHWLARKSGTPWRRAHDSIIDGLGEAADDLCPNSDFLCQLNQRPRNSRVRYSVLLGTGATLDEEHVKWVRECFCEKLAKVPGANCSALQFAEMLEDVDEIVEGKGDGIVAVKRGRLEGVSDTLILPFGHVAVTGDPDDRVLREVQLAVLKRVQ